VEILFDNFIVREAESLAEPWAKTN
jgi:hypothetical protein